MFKAKPEKIKYTDIAKIPSDYTDKMNKEYDWMAKGYDVFMTIFPFWKIWIKKVVPHIQGEKVLEVSFGSGYLMKQYALKAYEVYGIDYNEKMLNITQKKMNTIGVDAHLSLANVESLPYPDNTFDTVINTMAFTGYPDGDKAMSELRRVLKPNGKLLLIDFDFPKNRNIWGYGFVKLWERCGDIIKNISALLLKYDFDYESTSVGGFGSVQFFIARKK